jgi:hypothetical protein
VPGAQENPGWADNHFEVYSATSPRRDSGCRRLGAAGFSSSHGSNEFLSRSPGVAQGVSNSVAVRRRWT